MEIRSLERIPFMVVHQAFVAAFSDYSQPMTLSVADLMNMMTVRSGDLALSIGAFADEELVGFVLVGVRQFGAQRCGYDIATGVIPEFRGQGVATQLIRAALAHLHDQGIPRFVLEVIDSNEPALRLYRRLGFVAERRLECFRTVRVATTLPDGWVVAPLDESVDEVVLNGYRPSWQQSLASVRNVPPASIVVVQHRAVDGTVTAYGIVNPTTGSIMQLAVRPDWRSDAHIDALITAVSAVVTSPQLRMVNVEAGSWLAAALVVRGWELFVAQSEMRTTMGK